MTTFGPDREHPHHAKPLSHKGLRIDYFGSK